MSRENPIPGKVWIQGDTILADGEYDEKQVKCAFCKGKRVIKVDSRRYLAEGQVDRVYTGSKYNMLCEMCGGEGSFTVPDFIDADARFFLSRLMNDINAEICSRNDDMNQPEWKDRTDKAELKALHLYQLVLISRLKALRDVMAGELS